MLGNHKYKSVKNPSASNPLYADFWKEQDAIKRSILDAQDLRKDISELDKYKFDQIKRVQDEVKEYEKTHGNSGNFFTDFKFGVKSANNSILKPFNKYASPVLSMAGPIGSAIAKTTNTTSGIVDKLT